MIKNPKVLPIVFVLVGVLARLLPHAPNFTPIGAITIFGGAKLPKTIALFLPVLIMIIADIFLGFHSLIGYTWGMMLLTSVISYKLLRDRPSVSRLLTVTLLSSFLFFIVTNLGVWLEGKMYVMTLSGLIQCYVMALPFFKNSLIGDLFYMSVFFGFFEIIRNFNSRYSNIDA